MTAYKAVLNANIKKGQYMVVLGVPRSRQVYIELVVEALLICLST